LCSGLSPQQIAALANLAGGMVCEHSGVVSVNRLELLEEALKLKEFHD
jgi:bifunctional ADP-heptose synthase (sugar kinase/adenylyltransferase)